MSSRTATSRSTPRPQRRPGFTLLESLVSVSILGVVVLAVAAAISTSQQVAFEGQKRLLAAIAADDLLAELITVEYSQLPLWDGTVQPLGEMTSVDGDLYPETFWAIGREVTVAEEMVEDPETELKVRGVRITVAVIDEFGVIDVIETFRPEPAG